MPFLIKTESNDPKEAQHLLQLMQEMDLVQQNPGNHRWRVTAKGWQRFDEAEKTVIASQAFVAMW